MGLLLTILFFLGGLSTYTDSLIARYRRQLELYPHEKLYLQTDKPVYMLGEQVWFRVHQVDAATHRPMVLSRYAYAELIAGKDSVLMRVKLRSFDETFSGYLIVPQQATAGKYCIRAYTNYMRNWGTDYFFTREFAVGSFHEQEVTKKEKEPRIKDFHVSFFPEGGRLPAGVLTHVGIKALNNDGLGEEITGMLLDQKGDTVCTFETIHAGLGVMGVQVEAGKEYVAECRNARNQVKRFSFPVAQTGICNIQARWARDKLAVSLVNAADLRIVPDRYTLLIHSRGVVQYAQRWNPSHPVLLFDKQQFPSGVLQLLLVDETMQPISERLIFCQNDDQARVRFATDRPSYNLRELVRSTVRVTDGCGKPLSGSFSVSVSDDKDVLPDTTLTIRSYLLLSSDLKGYIENPEFYFGINPFSARALDCLMLTQGWRRYDNRKILAGEPERPLKYPLELGQYMDGKVTSLALRRPVKGAKVTALASKGIFVKDTVTDETGRFRLEGFEFPDSSRFLLTALSKRGNNSVEIEVDCPDFPGTGEYTFSRNEGIEESVSYRKKAYQRYFNDSVAWSLQLGEVVVEGKKRIPSSKNPFSGKGEWGDKVLTSEYIGQFHPSTLVNLLQLIPGAQVDGLSIYLPGAGGDASAKILIDGFEGDLSSLSVFDVESVEVIYPPRSNIYGMNTGGGVVYIITRTGTRRTGLSNTMSPNICELFPLGYQRPVEFYSPVYETQEQQASPRTQDLRTTLYWNPNVTISQQGEAGFDFYTADNAGSYSVVVEGVTSDGRTICCRARILVE